MPFGAQIGGPRRLLIVDDEPAICEALVRVLRLEGYAISTARDGESALALLERSSFGVLLTDMRMPGMNGARLLAHVATQHPSTVRVLLTGHADLEAAVSAINEGQVFRYLTKPWDDAQLRAALREAFALHEQVVARTAQLAASNRQLEERFAATLEVFASVLRTRLRQTAGAQRAMATLARELAEDFELDANGCDDVYRAALLCDLGKMSLPDEILRIPEGQLSGPSLPAYRQHPVIAEATLALLPPLDRAARLIRHHRERYDGLGYPDRLMGESIPLGSRILAAVRDYEAALHGELTGHALGPAEARDRIENGAGSAYDPTVVNAFTRRLAAAAGERGEDREVHLEVHMLREGMVVARDVSSPHGALLLREGARLDAHTIEILGRLSGSGGVAPQIPVRVA
ncbi:MAG: response regulator [Steroidobacteraceae bacterium]